MNVDKMLKDVGYEPKEEDEGDSRPWIRVVKSGLLISELAQQFGDIFKENKKVFYRSDLREVVEICSIKRDDKKNYSGFQIIKQNRFVSLVEKYCIPYTVKLQRNKELEENDYINVKTSLTKEKSSLILESPQFKETIPLIKRKFSVPMPIVYNGELTFPKKGYDDKFNSWLDYNSPIISNPNMKIEEAKSIFLKMFSEFCFESKQDYTNAIAAFITPFLRGLFPDFTTRTPFFFYIANRERAGKDFLASLTGIVLEGQALDDAPISDGENNSNKNDELRKKFTSLVLQGRRRIHFANNKGKINNSVLEQILTSKVISDRLLGKNENAILENEIDFSASGNVGIRFSPDLSNRCVFIKLFLDVEDANKRKFETPNLHQWVLENRDLILSAIYCLIKDWINNGAKKGTIPFASFPEWADICGGVLENAGYDSPCKSNDDKLPIGGDNESNEMRALFELCYSKHPDKKIKNKEIIEEIKKDGNLMGYYDFNEKKDQTKFGLKLIKYFGRIFSDIKLTVENPKEKKASRRNLIFTKVKDTIDKSIIFGKDYKKCIMPTLSTLPTNSALPLCNNNSFNSHDIEEVDNVGQGGHKKQQNNDKTVQNDENQEESQENKYQDLLEAIKLLPKETKMINAVDLSAFENLGEELNELKESGLIFEPKPNHYQLL